MPELSEVRQQITDVSTGRNIIIQVSESISVDDSVAVTVPEERESNEKYAVDLTAPIKTRVFTSNFAVKISAIAGGGIFLSSLVQLLWPGKFLLAVILSIVPVSILGFVFFFLKILRKRIRTVTN